MGIEKHHLDKMTILVGLGSLTVAVIGILGYLETKRDKELKTQINAIDLEIKQLELAQKKKAVSNT